MVFTASTLFRRVADAGERALAPGASATFNLFFSGRKAVSEDAPIDGEAEEMARRPLVDGYLSKLQLETPDPVLNRALPSPKSAAQRAFTRPKAA